MHISRALPRPAGTIATALAAGVLTACGGDEEVALPAPVPPAPTIAAPTTPALDLTAAEQEAFEAAQALFETFVANYQQILIDGGPALNVNFGQLEPFGGRLPVDAWDEVEDNFRHGRRAEGSLSWSLVDVEVDLDNITTFGDDELHIPLVRLRYCVDARDWRIVDSKTGQPAEPSSHRIMAAPGRQHLATIEFIYFDPIPNGENPQWRLEGWENEEGRAC